MKSNTLTTFLNAVLAVSLILSVIFCIQFIFLTREARAISGQINGINAYRAGIQALVNDCAAYAEKNPAMNPILESVGVKIKTAATNAPTKQPGTR